MPVQNKITHAIEIECDGCSKQLHEVIAVEPSDDTGSRWMSVVEDAGWLHISASLYSVDADPKTGDWPSTDIIACSTPCAQSSLGMFLNEQTQPEPASDVRSPVERMLAL